MMPTLTGSEALMRTIGIVAVAAFAESLPPAAKTLIEANRHQNHCRSASPARPQQADKP